MYACLIFFACISICDIHNVTPSHLWVCKLLSFHTNGIHEIIGKTAKEVNQPPNDVQVDEMFSEINLAHPNGPNVQENHSTVAQVNVLFPGIDMTQEQGSTEYVNQ